VLFCTVCSQSHAIVQIAVDVSRRGWERVRLRQKATFVGCEAFACCCRRTSTLQCRCRPFAIHFLLCCTANMALSCWLSGLCLLLCHLRTVLFFCRIWGLARIQCNRSIVHTQSIRVAAYLNLQINTFKSKFTPRQTTCSVHSRPNVYIHGESSGMLFNTQTPANHSFSQPTISQQIYPQNALIYASQPQNNIPINNPVQLHNVEQNLSLNSENQWQTVNK
jgi:hypothetical protein